MPVDTEDDFTDFKIPPIFEDFNERVKEYILKPERLSIHKWERSQTHWHRKTDVDSLLKNDDDEVGPDTTLEVVRDPITGEIIGLEEISIPNEDDEESLSMARAPLPPSLATRGTTMQSPFIPAGFEEELQKILEDAASIQINVNIENDEPGKFLGEDILTTPPGKKEGVIFAEDGVTVLNHEKRDESEKLEKTDNIDIQIKINLEEVVDSNVHLEGLWKDDDEQPKEKPKSKKVETDTFISQDDNFLESTIIQPPIELPDIPVLNITSSSVRTGVTSTEWAEMIDVSQPVPDFKEKIKDMAHSYPFELDNFQKQAILKLEEGHHVFVAAHTSAGKTVVAEYAIAMSRRNCTRAIYTSPIKALSNQKYNDFNKQFGEVGLLTGDLQINATASCLVMTTEILRSMLYCGSDVTRDLEFVIFDEVHYINNAERGYVWEEVLILLPAHVSIVMLSATVPNTLQFADWVGRTKKRKVYVVSTPKRPVPLCHYLYTGSGGKSKHERFLVIDQDGNFQLRGYNEAVAAKKARENEHKKNFGPKGNKQYMNPKADQTMWVAFIDHLKQKDKLPVVAFTLSRNRCDQNAENLMSVDLTTAKEKGHIRSFFQRCLQRLKEPDRKLPQVIRMQRVLENGIGVHHSGILPLLKEIVEMLFQSGFVKILFATETFAMGVNMPARTVVFDEVTKYDGKERRTLAPAEYIQMAGRAGRRGLDDTGTVIILCKDSVPDQLTLKGMMLGTPQKLSSQFRLTYAMILSLLRVATVSVEGMMQRSFREFHQICQADTYKKQLQLAEKEYSEKCSTPLPAHLAPLATFYDTAASYIDVLNDIMPVLLKSSKLIKELSPGRVLITSAGPYINQLGVFLNSSGPRQTPYKVLVLNTNEQDPTRYNFDVDDNWYRMLSFSAMYDYVGTEDSTLDHTILCIAPKNIVAVTKLSLKIDANIIIQDWEKRQMPRFKDAPVGSSCLTLVQELSRISHEVRTGVTKLDYISLKQSLNVTTGELLQLLDRMDKYKAELDAQKKITDIANFKTEFAIVYERKQTERKRDRYKKLLSFENLALYPDYQRRLMVLKELNYIDEHDSVILKGRVACGMGTNELIISELVFRNVFTDKSPAEIAALLSCFVFQARTAIEPALTEKLADGVKAIEAIDDELVKIEHKYLVDQADGQQERLNFGLVRVVYEWALEKPFAEIMDLTDVQEGIIVRCIQQLHELLIDVKDAAVAIGDPKLQAKMLEASTAIKRDIVFAASLYTTQKEAVTS
ncbi:superkiller complex protein 2 [Plodia interpunctella]|uniref:superkiller complex protein 2 n=1 Tax=Plodia interpunctella TaxID=58824 RepID=UPI00236838DC|nr:SKI2 subunit of superkiller complex protein [Plodia interpunctella]